MQCLGHNLREKGVDSIRRGVLKLVVAAVPETRRYFIAISEAVTANCVCSERYLGFRMLPWVQNVTLGSECYLGFRTLPWVQNATLGSERYLGFGTLPWVQNATLGSERYLGFRTLPWVQNATLGLERYLGFIMSLLKKYVHVT